jgi:hypothetical protein
MVQECLFSLPGGRACRNPARRGKFFCRHHENFLETPAPAAAESIRFSHIRHWREVGARIPRMSFREMDQTFSEILDALGAGAISHRCAGRFLQLIVRRTDTLRRSSSPEPAAGRVTPSPQMPSMQ